MHMKHKVNLSVFSVMISFIIMLILLWILYYSKSEGLTLTIGVIIITWTFLVGLYMPLSIYTEEDALVVKRAFKEKRIPYVNIQDIRPCPPTMAERRLLGSGGFFGYWGWFHEKDLGKYFAYYGKASDCFLVILKDGSQYMLGCEDPSRVVELIKSRI